MEKKFNFVYVTTNLINGKQYVDHSTDRMYDSYLGSGRPYFQRALKEYGRKNFKREILEFFDTKVDAFNAQEKYILQYNTLIPNGYNISPTGGHGVKNCWSVESKIKCSISCIGRGKGIKRSEESKQRQSATRKGMLLSTETKIKIGKANKISLLGHKATDETRNKISVSQKGKIVSIETRQKISAKEKGKIVSTETRKKQSVSQKGKTRIVSNNTRIKLSKQNSGEKNPNSKLNSSEIRSIKKISRKQ